MVLRKAALHIRDQAQKYGVAAAMYDLGFLAINTVVQFQILKGMAVRVQDVKDASLFDASGFEARFASEDELARYARDPACAMRPEFVREASARGDRCYALFDGEVLASYGWYSNRPTPIDEHFLLHFDPAYAYMYNGYTAPAYRGKRLHAVGMCRALKAVTDEGRRGLVSWVLSNNFASLRSVTRMGYRIFGDAYLLRAGSLCFGFSTSGCAEYGFEIEADEPGRVRAVEGIGGP